MLGLNCSCIGQYVWRAMATTSWKNAPTWASSVGFSELVDAQPGETSTSMNL